MVFSQGTCYISLNDLVFEIGKKSDKEVRQQKKEQVPRGVFAFLSDCNL